ncbi:MAG: UDP-N-acetyl-D-mannosamine dehydrogenase [Demequina sp.]
MSQISTVTVIGLGYIGLPTAAILATNGVRVHGMDVSEHTVDAVSRGEVPFVEPDLSGFVAAAVKSGALTASQDVVAADAYILAVPTPFNADMSPDLSYVKAAAEQVAPALREGDLVILESTSPPKTTEKVGEWIAAARPDLVTADGTLDVLLAHCPERVLPGKIMTELVTNDRIVGGVTAAAAERAKELYATFCDGEILLTDATTAEMAKLVENSFRDVNIAFANELSLIADELDINVWELIELANHHPRVNILQPGPGVGGHCIAVDPWFIVDAVPALSRIIRTAREVNDSKPAWVIDKVSKAVEGNPEPIIAVLGLAFKPDIDDLRESPALKITEKLADSFVSGRILAVEPHVDVLPASLGNRENVELAPLAAAVAAADAVVLLVDHRQFKAADVGALGIADKAVIDTKGIWTA